METQEEMIMKKKRSKRPRLASSSLSLTMATSTSCSTGAEVSDVNSIRVVPASSASSAGLDQEREDHHQEEDMAKCLILLAQGHTSQKSPSRIEFQAINKASSTDAYKCKTCNRCFSSFQALGGHRASHKKPKTSMEKQENSQFNDETTTLSLQILPSGAISSSTSLPNNSKIRVHECSICGAEFSSGQALGGHMRRHRPIPVVSSNQEEVEHDGKKPKTLLSLDLNLPAPEEDHHQLEATFPFAPKEQVIVFSASPLVDCHY